MKMPADAGMGMDLVESGIAPHERNIAKAERRETRMIVMEGNALDARLALRHNRPRYMNDVGHAIGIAAEEAITFHAIRIRVLVAISSFAQDIGSSAPSAPNLLAHLSLFNRHL